MSMSFAALKRSLKEIPQDKNNATTDIPDDFVKFNELIGLPQHPITLKPTPLTPAQLDFYSRISRDRPDWIHLLKARQCGWSEIVLRILLFEAFHKYKGKKIGIVAGTKLDTTEQLMIRLAGLLPNIRDHVASPWPIRNHMRIILKNGTEFHGGSANHVTFTGWTKFSAFLLDEDAKWQMVDDSPVLDEMLPIAKSNGSDVYMVSTPNGPRGHFYHIDRDPKTQFRKLRYDIHAGGKGIYTKQQIDEMLASPDVDVDQEYLCKFTAGRGSIFGANTEDDVARGTTAIDFNTL